MNTIKAFFAKHTITANSIAAAWASATLAYLSVPPFAQLVDAAYNATPHVVKTILLAASGLAAYYSKTHKETI